MTNFFDIDESSFEIKKPSNFVNKYIKYDDPENRVRILPPFSERKSIFSLCVNHPFLDYYYEKDDRKGKANPICLNFLFEKKDGKFINDHLIKIAVEEKLISQEDLKLFRENEGCPLCQISKMAYDKADASKDTGGEKIYKGIADKAFAKEKYFFNVWDYSKNGNFIWTCSRKIYETVVSEYRLVKQDENINIFDYKNGRDATIKVEGKEKNKRYSILFYRKSKPLSPLTNLHNLDKEVAYGVKDYYAILDIIKQNDILADFVADNKISFAE